MNLIIDIGNTRVKAAVFENNSLQEVVVFNESEMIYSVQIVTRKFKIKKCIIASVKNMDTEVLNKLHSFFPTIELNSKSRLPFKNLYNTKATLGVDRIAIAAAAVTQYPNKNTLVIDAGTCITYDFVTKGKEYLGGAISLGLEMRYKSLNNFTDSLPLLEISEVDSLIGNSTEESIHSGVVNGTINEIKGVIEQYEKKIEDLTVVLTGGDTYFLSKQLKSSIFANPNFVLEGLNAILIYNEEEC